MPSDCVNCSYPLRPRAQFCPNCGRPAAADRCICPKCGIPQRPQARYCANCGSNLTGNTAVLAPKWRPVVFTSAFGAASILVIIAMTLFITRLGGNGQAQLSPTLSSAAVQPPRTQAQPEVVVKPFPPLEPTAITLNIPGLSIEIPRLSDREEIAIGRQAVQEFERQILISSDPSLSGRVDAVGRKISAHTPRSNLPYTFKVIETDEINAYALPGGYIYVARGLLEFVRSQDELAGVIGHEIAHVGLRHGARLVEGLAAAEIALEAIATQNPDLSHIYSQNEVQLAAQAVAEIAVNGWSRHAELDADEYGAVYMHLVGYDVQGYLDLLERIRALEAVTGKAGSIERLLATHPPFDERIFRVGEAVKKPGLKR